LSERLTQLFQQFHAQQRLPEYLAFADRLGTRLNALNTAIEIGSSAGGTLALLAELSAPDALLVAVDLPQSADQRHSNVALAAAAAGRRFVIARSDSRSAEAIATVAGAVGDAGADVLFIDGGHQAAVVRSDLRTYTRFVRDGGIVAFHDIVVHPEFPDVRVHELWAELRTRFPGEVEEIVEAADQTWGGIGLLTVGPEVRAYLSQPELTPIFINNFNRLTSTRAMAEWIGGVRGARAIILDNASDWPPLLAWYERCPVEVRRLGNNLGHRAPWLSGAVGGVTASHYVVTDPDLAMNGCPADVLEVLADALSRFPWATKAGVGLEIGDLPERYPSREFVLDIEQRYWTDRLDARFFRAPIDTTFAVYRAGEDPPCAPAVRADRPYVARHLPWYVTPENLDNEERHYLRSADLRFSSGTAHTKDAYS
jgi:predicted O-methyltransferase YrrM